jgi:leucyl aminopeptidase
MSSLYHKITKSISSLRSDVCDHYNLRDYDIHFILFPSSSVIDQLPNPDAIYDFDGSKGTHFWYGYANDDSRISALLYGIGSNKSFSEKTILESVSHGIDLIREKKKKRVLLDLSFLCLVGLSGVSLERFISNVVMSVSLTNYKFDTYIAKSTNVQRVNIYLGNIHKEKIDELNRVCKESLAVSQNTNLARSLSNERADVATPQYIADIARGLLEYENVYYEELSGRELIENGNDLNLFYAVGQGSRHVPKLVCLKYYGKESDDNKNIIAFVGKGITYDTGGLNLKPTNSIENMYLDKSGACIVLSLFRAIVTQRLNVNVVVVLGLAENAIGSYAYKPYSIIRSANGKTVRVANTDAEGRLVLADCITWVQNRYRPELIIDIATLTGSCVSALGEHFCGVFGNSKDVINKIIEYGDQKYERGHHMPLIDEHRAELKCAEADLNSMGGKNAGASTAAAFLSEFVDKDTKWVHIDVAGTAMRSKKSYWLCENGTGFGVQMLYDFVKNEYQ